MTTLLDHHIDTADGPVDGSNPMLVEFAALLCAPRVPVDVRLAPDARIPSHFIAPRRAAALLAHTA